MMIENNKEEKVIIFANTMRIALDMPPIYSTPRYLFIISSLSRNTSGMDS